MNEALKKELEQYFYGDSYGRQGDCKEVVDRYKEYYKLLDPLRTENEELFRALEDSIGSAEVSREKQGFLRGYKYALTMMGRAEA